MDVAVTVGARPSTVTAPTDGAAVAAMPADGARPRTVTVPSVVDADDAADTVGARPATVTAPADGDAVASITVPPPLDWSRTSSMARYTKWKVISKVSVPTEATAPCKKRTPSPSRTVKSDPTWRINSAPMAAAIPAGAEVSSVNTKREASQAPAVAPPVGADRAVTCAGSVGDAVSMREMVAAVIDVPSNVAAVPPVPTADVRVSATSTPSVPVTAVSMSG